MSIKFIRAGLSTSIQDAGRFGYGSCGIPQSGVMDQYTAQLTNLIAGNRKNDPVLEITRSGPKLEMNTSLRITIGGLAVETFLNGKKLNLFEAFTVKKGDVLEINRILKGNFAYLSIYGGFETRNLLSSKSMYQGVTSKARFKNGDVLKIQTKTNFTPSPNTKVSFDYSQYKNQIIQVYPGPEFGLLTEDNQMKLASQLFTLTPESNRMAFTFKEKLTPQKVSILTAPVLPGTIQLTSGGSIIALMKDAQVTGGYPRILQITEEAMNILAQKQPGDQIGFQLNKFI